MAGNFVLTNDFETVVQGSGAVAYAIGDVISASTPVPYRFNIGRLDMQGYITNAILTTSRSAHTEALRLHLFSQSITVPADNAALVLDTSWQSLYLGYVDFSTFITSGAGSTFALSVGAFNRPSAFFSNDGTVYGVLEARAAFTPTAGQTFNIRLFAEVPA